MISTSGMSPFLGITLVRENRETFEADVQRDPMAKREIAAFRERIGSIETVEDLTADYEVFSFVMKSFGLEDEIYAKAMMEKILVSDPEDKTSLVSKLNDSKYKQINAELGFTKEGQEDTPPGIAGANLTDPDWVESMIERFTDQRLIDTQSDQNESVGLALGFEQKVSEMTNWYKVLADKDVTKFIMTAFGLPDSFSNASVDAKKRMFEDRMPIEELQKPEVQEKLIRQFSAFAAVTLDTGAGNPALTLLSSGSNFNQVTIDIDMVQGFSGSAYL